MGNRSSSNAAHPAAPPPLLSAAVTGDPATFTSLWIDDKNDRLVKDRQDNNVLHALFSCRVPLGKPGEILRVVHQEESLSEAQLVDLYTARNQLGCNPLWILVAYGNVELFKQVMDIVNNKESLRSKVPELLVQPNHQGDSPLLATCSQGNCDMVKFLSGSLDAEQITALLAQGNQKGTTPLQIVVANGHEELLHYLLEHHSDIVTEQLWHVNAAGLSLFHICSERNFQKGLELLLRRVVSSDALEKVLDLTDKNGANALHVACFCGNDNVVQVWVKVITEKGSGAVALLDRTDGQGRTGYWLAMVQGHEETIGSTLAAAGVDTQQPDKMLQEIKEAQERRVAKRAASQQPAVDGDALLRR